jgi:hypothetical protein
VYSSWSPKEQFECAYLSLENGAKIMPSTINDMIAKFNANKIDDKTILVKVELTTGFTQYATSACVATRAQCDE